MKKLLAAFIALVLIACLPVMAFATEEIPSPTDKPVFSVEVTVHESEETTDQPIEIVSEGDSVTFTATEGGIQGRARFVLEGEYEIVAGAQYIVETGEGVTVFELPAGAQIVVIPASDLKVDAYYETDPEPTEPPVDDDTNDSPQTGDDMLVLWIGVALLLGIVGCVVATKSLRAKKEN